MDKTTVEWFDAAQVTVVVNAAELKGWLANDQWVRLSGAPIGSTLTVQLTPDGLVELRVDNPALLAEPMVRLIAQEPDGYAFYIVNAVFVLNEDHLGYGIGPRSVSVEIQQAKKLGFTRIRTFAVGNWASFDADPPLRGYYVWPNMGFDGPLPEELRHHPELPRELLGSTRILQLWASEAGQDFWMEFGSSVHVEFNLEDGTPSWERHRRYTEQRNIEVKP